MSEAIKACIDRIVPEELVERAFQLAVTENPRNRPEGPYFESMNELELALIADKKWEPGRTLKVAFLDGDPDVQAKIQPYAHQWSDYASIDFDFGNHANPEIRISFNEPGSWSYLGTDSLVIGPDQPTMNFGWLEPGSADEEYERVVVHEFGHALGCIHEHQHPIAGIPWDEDKVYEYYMGPPNNWTAQQVYRNLLRKYEKNSTQFSLFDTDSIMLYPVPNSLTIGDFEIGWNRKLSETDKQFICEIYPPVQVTS